MKAYRDIIIIPTYNEKDNIGKIIEKVSGLYPELEIWVVDDSSPDGTAKIVSTIMKSNPKVSLIVRKAKTGLGDAYKDTLIKIQKMGDVRSVITMDADGSHNPLKIRELLDSLQKVDLSIGSRYTSGGGGMKGMGMYRNFLSMGGNLYARIIIGFGINDSTAGFVAFRRTALDGINIPAIASAGYSYQIEFKNTLLEAGRSWNEIPITFVDRIVGTSKMSGRIIKEGILTPWRIAARKTFKWSHFKEVLKKALLISTVLCAFMFALFHLKESPPVWYDEGLYIQDAVNLVQDGIVGVRFSPDIIRHVSEFSVGFPLTYSLAGFFNIFGIDIFTARLLMILFILGLIISSYFLIKKLYGRNIAIISTILLSTFPPLYGNGKSVLGETPGLLFLVLALLFVYLARTKFGSRNKYIVFAGLFVGLAVATKPFFLILIPALIVGLFSSRKIMQIKMSDLYLGSIATLIPIIIWLTTQFQSGDSFLKIFSFYANPYQVSSIISIVFNSIKSLFTSVGPLYLMVVLFVWLVSLIIKFKRRSEISPEEITAFTFSVLCVLAYLRISGIFRYLYPAQVISLIFFPSALAYILNTFSTSWFDNTKKKFVTLGLAIVFIPLTFLGIYQVLFNSWVAEAYGSNKTADWQNYFEKLPSKESVFFYDTPEVAIFMNGSNYYQYIEPAPSMKIGTEELDVIRQGITDKVVITTGRLSGLDQSLFVKYSLDKTFYKYSILKKIKK
ncbi:MAG: glycosyltransferase [Candidatus Paceibacterota bacterium]